MRAAAAAYTTGTDLMDTAPKAKRREPAPSGRASILVVEDERDLQDLLQYNLARDGFVVTCASSAEEAQRLMGRELPDLIILDLMLPGMDGLEFCRRLKGDANTSHLPVVMLTAKGEEADIVTGLELGADDYVPKPFSPRVLMARIKAVLRRGTADGEDGQPGDGSVVRVRDLVVDPSRHEVSVNNEKVDLTATEFKLLSLLASRPGRVFTRQQIIESIHGRYAAVTDRSVDVQVVTLRRKLGERGSDVETVRGVGYRFKE
jgi:two-component system phosphate regulon response regulator PhoB